MVKKVSLPSNLPPFYVNVPFDRLRNEFLELFIENKIRPEIGLDGDLLYNRNYDDFKKIADELKRAELPCTIHAPFFDLIPGALDRNILCATREKLQKAFELIPLFEPVSIVCHLGYEDNKHEERQEEWLKTSVETWSGLSAVAEKHGTLLMLENTYETGPEPFRLVFEKLNSPCVGFCLDVGHTLAFARNNWQDWLPALEPWLGQLHLHDNHGDRDSHLAIGEGIFDFTGLFDYLNQKDMAPIITLEPHDEEAFWGSIKALEGKYSSALHRKAIRPAQHTKV